MALFPPLSHIPGRFAWEMSEAQDGFHQPAAAGIRKPVQAQQVLVQTKALRGGHFAHADRDTGESEPQVPRTYFNSESTQKKRWKISSQIYNKYYHHSRQDGG